MRRIALVFAALAVGLVLSPLGADATHVSEPTAPVTGISLRMGEYPGVNQNPLTCDGTEQVTFENLRIEPLVTVSAKPSEHWVLRISVFKGSRLDWDVQVPHQNAPPHFIGTTFEAAQSNQYRLSQEPGPWTVTATVSGQESGARYSTSCTFTKLAT